ncbi:MAG: type II toxin-antitoxin system HicB family antitoxin [Armatimonadetes bacterium]|nr:type II toxin-antitoxin system HicB family antitoxin [Armatimonadota bacterium]
MDLQLSIIYIPAEDGWFTAYLAEIPGAVGQGKSQEEARENLLSALEEVFEVRREEDKAARAAEFGQVNLHIA